MYNKNRVLYKLKLENRNRIYNAIREKKGVTRQDLVYELKLSLPTITQNLTELIEEGLIEENGSIGNTGGRRARSYGICGEARVAIGLDITKHHITIVTVNLKGETIHRNRIRQTFERSDEYFKKLGELVEEAVSYSQLKPHQIEGVGIVLPGLISEDSQKIFYGEILKITGATCEEFSKYIPYSCMLFNDADAGGYAEAYLNEDESDSFYISLSNNIGGSIIINGEVYKGEGPRSGEVGHITIIPDGRKCYCGRKGCFETYCNATILSDYTEGNIEGFFRELQSGNQTCMEMWKEYLKYLAIAVNNVRMLFDCKVILGGYVGAYMDQYINRFREMAAERNSFEDNADYLHVCKVKKDALALGGALPFIQEFIQNI